MDAVGLILADLAAEFGNTAWFARIGAKPSASDRGLAADYFAKLDTRLTAVWLHDLGAAVALLRRGEADEAWASAEGAAEKFLSDAAASALGKTAANHALNHAMLAASDAAMAAAKARFPAQGRNDEGLMRVAAGAAARAAAAYALVHLAGANLDSHPFTAKFRLYAAGRWPLVAREDQFAVL